jgi:hypothetical protein
MRAILGSGGKVRGYIVETATGQQLLAPGGALLGYYDRNSNLTYFPGGNLVGYGNQLMMLLE